MAKFRKKPVVVDAFQWTVDEAPDWWKLRTDKTMINVQTGSVFIPTLEGTHETRVDDFIIRGIKGELYPCKPDIFEATYEEVE